MPSSQTLIRAAFLMEQHLGHYTFYQNLRRFVEAEDQTIQARWVEISYTQSNPLWNSLPLPARIKGTLTGSGQVVRGLSEPYDIAFFNTQVPAALAERMLHRRHYVLSTDITPRQYDEMGVHYQHKPDPEGWVSRYKRQVNLTVFQGAARVLAWSNWAARSLSADYRVPTERIEVVSPGVDLDLWRPGDPRDRPPGAPLRILFVGGDFYRKGGDLLLDAFDCLPPGSAELALVTRTPVAPRPGVAVYANLRPNDPALRALYQSADVFALPTRAEAFGIAAAEASAMALPVVAAQVGGLSDIVQHGETGLLIPPNDKHALVGALNWLSSHPVERRQMGRAARARAEACFDARKNAARIVQILKEIVTGSKRQ